MNDFTQEELQTFVMWGELYKSGAGIAWPKLSSKKVHEQLLKKLQSMIDNYGEHEECLDCPVCGVTSCLLVSLNNNE